MRILIMGFIIFIGWSALSTYIYLCKIRMLCPQEQTTLVRAVNPKDTLTKEPKGKETVTIPKALVTYFAFDKSNFIPDEAARAYFEKSNAYIQQYTQAKISITGHTDAVGTIEYNQALGMRRAQTMQMYFASMGMPENSIKIESKGEKEPVANNSSDEGRAKNRRTVVTIKKHENQIDKLKNTKNEQKISEQDEALLQMAKRKHLLNYSSFGTATIEEKLNVLGIFTLRQIANFNDEDVEIVTEAIEFFPGRIERDEWVSQAKELLKNKGKRDVILDRVKEKKSNIPFNRIGIAPKHFANNLTLIKGISPWVEEKLNKLDIFTFAQVSKLTAEDVNTITEILEIAPKRIERDNWIGQAKEFAKAKATSPQH